MENHLEFGISFFITFSAILRLNREYPVVTGRGNPGARRKPPLNPKVIGNFLTCHGWDSNPDRGERPKDINPCREVLRLFLR